MQCSMGFFVTNPVLLPTKMHFAPIPTTSPTIVNTPLGSVGTSVPGTSANVTCQTHMSSSTNAPIVGANMQSKIAPDPRREIMENTLQPPSDSATSLPTPVKIDKLLPFLEGYPQEEINYLHQGFTKGFRVGFQGPQLSYFAENSKKLQSAPDVANNKIQHELAAGRISGPHAQPPLPNFRVSPLSIRPKKTEGHFRLIHDLSFPYDNTSTNAGIPDDIKTVHYASISDAMNSIVTVGPNCF